MVVPILLANRNIIAAFRRILYRNRPRICRVLLRRLRVLFQPFKAVTRSFNHVRRLVAIGAKGRQGINVASWSLIPGTVNVGSIGNGIDVIFLPHCLPRWNALVNANAITVNVRVIISLRATGSNLIRNPVTTVITSRQQYVTRDNRDLNYYDVSNDGAYLRNLGINFKVRRTQVARRALNGRNPKRRGHARRRWGSSSFRSCSFGC